MQDPTHLGELFDRHAPTVLLYARQWLDRATAEDVVQEAFLKLWQGRDIDEPRAWLFRVTRRIALNALRGEKRRRKRERQVVADGATWFRADPSRRMAHEELQTLLTTLPPSEREVVVLRIWGGLTFAEISEITGTTVSTLHREYQQSLERLREKVEAPCQKR